MTVDNKSASKDSESGEKKSPVSKLFSKLKTIKHIEIYIAVLLGVVILLIYLSGFMQEKKEDPQGIEYSSMTAYAKDLQDMVASVLSNVNGAGKVDVLILFEHGIELVIAYSTETREVTSGGTTTVTVVRTPILVNQGGSSQPIILSEILPRPKSIIVVASGAKDTKVKLDLLMAIQTLFHLPSSNIEILPGR
jgi:stage III sporulation protein AG